MVFPAVRTIDDLDILEAGEVVQGYRDGRAGTPVPGDNRSTSYRHGWRNGATDTGLRQKDVHQIIAARIFHRSQMHS